MKKILVLLVTVVLIHMSMDVRTDKDLHGMVQTLLRMNYVEFKQARGEELILSRIAAGADVNIQDSDGNTLLMTAVREKKFWIANIFLNTNADVNKKNNNGENVLHVLALHKDRFLQFAQHLLDLQANPNEKNNNGHTPLMVAALHNSAITSIFVRVATSLHEQDADGNTALMLAARSGALEAGSEIYDTALRGCWSATEIKEFRDMKNNYGQTAHDIAIAHNHSHMRV